MVIDKPAGIFDWYTPLDLAWLDFLTASTAGQTAVTLDGVDFLFQNGALLHSVLTAGSIRTGTVPDAAVSFGHLKAGWTPGS